MYDLCCLIAIIGVSVQMMSRFNRYHNLPNVSKYSFIQINMSKLMKVNKQNLDFK